MSESTSQITALPTASEIEGSLLPSTVETRLELPDGPPSTAEVATYDPNWSQAPEYKKPRKKRIKPPKESRIYKAAIAYVALKAQGLKGPEIAEQLGLEASTLKQYVHIANKRGWLNIESFSDPEDKLEIVLASKTVRNINEFLDGRDKETTIEVAKGLGMLKQHQVVKGEQTTQLGLALKVDVQMPIIPQTGQLAPIQIRPGSVGGQPIFEGVVVDEEKAHASE